MDKGNDNNALTKDKPSGVKVPEFLFGELSTKEGRLRRARLSGYGFYHDSILHPPDPKPGEPITISVRVGVDVDVKKVTLFYTTDGTTPSKTRESACPHVSMQRTKIEWDTLQWGALETWSAQIPGQPAGTHVQYLIQGTTPEGKKIYSPTFNMKWFLSNDIRDDFDTRTLEHLSRIDPPQIYGFIVDEEVIPSWLDEAIIYQVFVDRFAPDPGKKFADPSDLSSFYGGTLRGVLEKLDYLSDLGINCLWLTPIFPSLSYHGYDVIDYGTIEPRLGTEADFQTLLDEAHRKGIRVLLDFVANHCSHQHPAFVAAQQDRSEPTYCWFRFLDWPDQYESFYDLATLPKFNTDNSEVRAHLIENAKYWLEQGVDGFRLDHAHGATHAFWSAFREATRSIRANSITLGEVTETPSLVRSFSGRMDGCLDFRLLELLRAFFIFDTIKASQLDKGLRQHFAYFGSSLALPSFLDNHDMNRFMWRVDNDKRRLRLAALCQFTQPGPPIIYYGTEVGLSQLESVGRLEEARLPMLWGDEQDASLLAFYKELISLRRQNPSVWAQPRQTMIADDNQALYAYACGPYAVLLNNSSNESKPSLVGWQVDELILATEPGVSLSKQKLDLYLPPYAGAVFRLASS